LSYSNYSQLNSNNSEEKLSGIVKRVTFHSPQTGWSVLKITPFNNSFEEVAVTIYQSKVFAGASVDFYGSWVNNPKYGMQFKADKIVEKKPASVNALEKYLGSGLIKGVGPKTAKAIVKHFKNQTLEIFDKNIQKLTQVPGIAKQKLEMIQKGWLEHTEIKEVMMFLQSYGISTLFAVKIFKIYGQKAIEIVSQNPYKLAQDVYGIGFFSADKIALNLGFEEKSEVRIKAGIEQVLASSRENGHCYLTLEQIQKELIKLLQLEVSDLVLDLLDKMEKESQIKVRILEQKIDFSSSNLNSEFQTKTEKCYYSPSIYYDENFVAQKILDLNKKNIKIDQKKWQKWLETFCKKQQIELSEEQKFAVLGIIKESFSVLTGSAGCGKTTTVKVLVQLILAMNKKVILAAPTGRAAQRMMEVIGLEAKTIHRLLEWQPQSSDFKGGFKKNEQDNLNTDFLILDETSMLDIHLSSSLLRAISAKTQVLFIGDYNQLPAVGAGNVLKDLILSKVLKCFNLTKIFRQAKDSLIIKYAHQINNGQTPLIDSPFAKAKIWQNNVDCMFIDSEEITKEQLVFLQKVKTKFRELSNQNQISTIDFGKNFLESESFFVPDKFKHIDFEKLTQTDSLALELRTMLKKVPVYSSLNYNLTATKMIELLVSQYIPKYRGKMEIQILSPMIRGSLGTINLNKIIQNSVNPQSQNKTQITFGEKIFRVGDRIIQKKNNYDLDIFNGDIGKIVEINNQEMLLTAEFGVDLNSKKTVIFEKDSLTEIDLAYAITIHKSQGSEFEAVILPITTQHFNMLFRNLLYTGITRGKKLVILVGSRKALSLAVKNIDVSKRQTALARLLGKI
jgi:exodeoxyribonuclease V alpha subunit